MCRQGVRDREAIRFMKNIKMTVVYDGTAYLGWQKTRMGPSIEEALQNILEKILQEKIILQAASRTDAGVHARGQVVNFLTIKQNLDVGKLQHGLNHLLPRDIVITEVLEVDLSFHPTLDCLGKEYCYSICCGPFQLPQHKLYSWHVSCPMDFDQIQIASKALIGRHDFSSLSNSPKTTNYSHTIREMKAIDILRLPDQRVEIHMIGNNFLYKMARNIIGLLCDVGKGKIGSDQIPKILSNCRRSSAGVTAPAYGLSLHKVFYPKDVSR